MSLPASHSAILRPSVVLLITLTVGGACASGGPRGAAATPAGAAVPAAAPSASDEPVGPRPVAEAGGPRRSPEPESATARAMEALRHDPARLYAFLRAMPKGGDLHSHLSGAIYAESFLRWAADDGACVTLATLTLVPPPCDGPAGRPSASAVLADGDLRSRVIDAFSMRNYKPAVENGHDRFFATFGRFGLASDEHLGDMLAEVSHRAAEGRVRYLELMHTAGGGSVGAVGRSVGWDDDWGQMRQRVLDAGLRDTLRAALRQLDHAEAVRSTDLGCGTADADPGCGVTVRYLYQVLRAFPREQVFAQILAGFELTRMDPRFVGLNLVQPEDDRVAMRDYDLHMRIIGFLKARYPDVPVSLHAGELAEGLVPPEGLRFHIREAVEVAGARRIGHGVDVLHEDDPDGLLEEMARRRVMVEINLTSNDVILGVTGPDHPLGTYLAYGVPVALSTDDEGVSRSEMTAEYMRAVLDQGVGYPTLKAMARNSLEYAFVEGESVWRDLDTLAPVPACAPEGGGWTGDACAAFAAGSTKAKLQVGLERDLGAFEARVAAGTGPVLIPGSD